LTGGLDASRKLGSDSEQSAFFADPATILHGWTPREPVRKFIAPLAAAGLRYLIHLEDDESLVTASQLGVRPIDLGSLDLEDFPQNLTHPVHSHPLLAGAAAVTLIVPHLRRGLPLGPRSYVLEPGVDCTVFAPQMDEAERLARREALGFGKATTLIVYPGNVHQAIQRDIFSLYTAIRVLRCEGLDVQLLRTGMSECATSTSTNYKLADGVRHLGNVPRREIPRLLELADLFIQPGWLNPFNASRLPSKLLEFLAMGRPTVVSKVSLGARLKDGKNAVVLPGSGGATDIVQAVKRLMSSSDLAAAIGAGGRLYAQDHFNWNTKVDQLERIYSGLPARPS